MDILVIIKNSPNTTEGKKRLEIAKDTAADILLLEDGVYFALEGMLKGFCGTVYAVEEDLKLRKIEKIKTGIKLINYKFVDNLIKEYEILD